MISHLSNEQKLFNSSPEVEDMLLWFSFSHSFFLSCLRPSVSLSFFIHGHFQGHTFSSVSIALKLGRHVLYLGPTRPDPFSCFYFFLFEPFKGFYCEPQNVYLGRLCSHVYRKKDEIGRKCLRI